MSIRLVDDITAQCVRLITELGYTAPDLAAYPDTPVGFSDYIGDSGLHHFDGKELARCHNPRLMHSVLGRDWDLPEHAWWSRILAVACVADRLRRRLGQPVAWAWGYRRSDPDANVNKLAHGEPDSDHVYALAADLDHPTIGLAREAEAWLVEFRRRFPWAYVSLGFAAQRQHVGLFRPAGEDHHNLHARSWVYKSRRADLGRVLLEAEHSRPFKL